jgi:integrase
MRMPASRKPFGRPAYGSAQGQAETVVKIRLWLRKRKNDKRPPYTEIAHRLNNWRACTGCGEYFEVEGLSCKKCGGQQWRRTPKAAPGGGEWTGPAVKRIALRKTDPRKEKARKIVKRTLHADDYLNAEQIGMVLRSCPPRDRLIFETLLGTGMRPKVEFCQLQIRDLGVFQGKHQVDVRCGKRRIARSITISKELAAKLRRHRLQNRKGAGRTDPVFLDTRGDRLSYDALLGRMKKLGTLAGVGRLNCYRCRHSFGSLLYEDKKDLNYVAQQMGHKSLDVTRMYVHISESEKSEQMEGFQRRITEAENSRESPRNGEGEVNIVEYRG